MHVKLVVISLNLGAHVQDTSDGFETNITSSLKLPALTTLELMVAAPSALAVLLVVTTSQVERYTGEPLSGVSCHTTATNAPEILLLFASVTVSWRLLTCQRPLLPLRLTA